MIISGRANWTILRPKVDLKTLPQTVDLSPSRIAAIALILIGGVWCLVTVGALADMGFSNFGLPIVIAAIFPSIGLIMIVGGLNGLLTRRRVTFNRYTVSLDQRGLFRDLAWTEPYTAFEGILHREYRVRRRKRTRTYQIIELHHTDPKKTLPVYVEETRRIPRQRWEDYARALGLPALEQGADGLVRRDARDLDKSLKDLASEGKVDVNYSPDRPPPNGIKTYTATEAGGRSLHVVITAGRLPWWFVAIFLAVPAGIAVAALAGKESWQMSLFALATIGVVSIMVVYDRLNLRRLAITARRVSLVDTWRWGRDRPDSLSLDEIESVHIRGAKGGIGNALILASDRGDMEIGAGLSREGLAWLRDYVTAAIVHA